MSVLTVSAPGSVMVTGEHAVVYGHPAMVAAIDQRIMVELARRKDGQVQITSQIAGPLRAPLDQIPENSPYRFVIAALSVFAPQISTGIDINIGSEIDPTLGLGSSAAVTVATLGGLAELTGTEKRDLHDRALAIVRNLQGRGSGADLAASLNGGLLAYSAPTDGGSARLTSLPEPPPLSLRYTGYKTPTGEVLERIARASKAEPEKYDALYKEMGETSCATIEAVKRNRWGDAATLLQRYQGLMEKLGVSDGEIDRIIGDARGTSDLLACKISGSGLGDCVLAIGTTPPDFIPVTLAKDGFRIDA